MKRREALPNEEGTIITLAGSGLNILCGQELEWPDCPLCGSSQNRQSYELSRPYRVVRCEECGFFFLRPRSTESVMLNYYSDDGYYNAENINIGYQDYGDQELALRETFRRLIRELTSRGLTGGDVLDVGCGNGLFLGEAKGSFERRVGTDYSRAACDSAQARADEVLHGGLEEIPRGSEFDLIVAIQVIEHLYDPVGFFDRILQLLREGGAALVATPNMGSPWRRAMGKHWPSFKVPEHVLYFDRRSLPRLMTNAGLRDVSSIPYPHAFSLKLVASKLDWRVPTGLGRKNVWLPSTTICFCGRKP